MEYQSFLQGELDITRGELDTSMRDKHPLYPLVDPPRLKKVQKLVGLDVTLLS
jgi:hypothetical protein